MPFSVFAVAIITAIAAFVSGSIALYAWQRREVIGARAFALCSTSIFIWCFFSVFEVLSTEEGARIVFARAQYLGISFFSVFWLVFTLRYAQLDGWINRRSLSLLCVIPSTTMLLALSDPWHDWLWQSVTLRRSSYLYLDIEHGWWFNYVMVPQSYVLFVAGFGVLLSASFAGSRLYQRQTLLLLVAAILPFICNVLYVLSGVTLYGLDLTPVSFAFGGVLLQCGLFRTRFLQTSPISYKTVFMNTADAVILLDSQCRIVDLNPSAQIERRQPQSKRRTALGCAFEQIFPDYGDLLRQALQQRAAARHSSQRHISGQHTSDLQAARRHVSRRHFLEEQALTKVIQLPGKLPNRHTGQVQTAYREVKVRSLLSPGQWQVGWVIIIRDVTLEKQQQAQLERFAYLDSLTGLFNRRQLELTFEAITREVKAEAEAEATNLGIRDPFPLDQMALLYIDLNRFKPINDDYGHEVGDEVLKHFAQCLKSSVRQGDMVVRLGGDEFAALLYDATPAVAQEVRDLLRKILSRSVTLRGYRFTLSASIGIAYCSKDSCSLPSLLRRADEEMYQEKRLAKEQSQPLDSADRAGAGRAGAGRSNSSDRPLTDITHTDTAHAIDRSQQRPGR